METRGILSVTVEWISCLSSLGNSLVPSSEHHRGCGQQQLSQWSLCDVSAAAQLDPLWAATIIFAITYQSTPFLVGRAGWLLKVYIPGERKILVSFFLGLLLLYMTYPSWAALPPPFITSVFKYTSSVGS